jgi:outer membrane protein assembly factor BamB
MKSFASVSSTARLLVPLVATMLVACSGGSNQPKPTELTPVPALVSARQAWSARVGAVNFPLGVHASGNTVTVAGSDGTVAALDAQTGQDVWRVKLAGPLAAGVGSDGRVAAVVTQSNDVVAMQDGRELWRSKLSAQVFTPPLVAGGRVFVLAADRTVHAFDGQDGRKLWMQQRPSEPLVLRQAGVLLAVGDTLVAGLSGRLAGLDPANGNSRWEVPIASPRGINDIERLVDLVAPVSRVGSTVCARAFQAALGCVNTDRGGLVWTKPANGDRGLDGDALTVFGTEADSTVTAWRRTDGERSWTTDRLRFRSLTAPAVVGRSLAVGDYAGLVHLISREDGSLLNRLTTDGSAIVSTPVLAGDTLVVVTRNGGVFGFVPQ